jgi:hypothetical protein
LVEETAVAVVEPAQPDIETAVAEHRRRLATMERPEEIQELIAVAEAIRTYWKKKAQAVKPIDTLIFEANLKLGKLAAAVAPGQGKRTDLTSPNSGKVQPAIDIPHQRLSEAVRAASAPPEVIERYKEKAAKPTVSGFVKFVNQWESGMVPQVTIPDPTRPGSHDLLQVTNVPATVAARFKMLAKERQLRHADALMALVSLYEEVCKAARRSKSNEYREILTRVGLGESNGDETED